MTFQTALLRKPAIMTRSCPPACALTTADPATVVIPMSPLMSAGTAVLEPLM